MQCFIRFILAALLLPPAALAQSGVFLLDREGNPGIISEIDEQFILSRFDMLNLETCTPERLSSRPRLDYRRLEVPYGDQTLKLHIAPDVMRSGALVLYTDTPDGTFQYMNCETGHLLPVLALMTTASFDEASEPSLLRPRVLAQNSYLTSHEPNRLMARRDSDDVSNLYMDFTVSSKYPVLPNAVTINSAYDQLTETMEQLIPGDDEYFLQLYFAFSGRFSQYVNSRKSEPVIARRFNPEIFFRFWSSEDNYMDVMFGHESNGQRINDEISFEREEEIYAASGEPRVFARDNLSRGWDYAGLNWQREWNAKLITQLELQHFFSNGPLQGGAEEYNTWEDGGSQLRPRRQYDGVSLDIQYNFNATRCLLGELPICFSKLQLTQETGYSAMFENNSTTLELTTDFFGLPIQLWARSGYNSDLVDYYNYSNSWGVGIELISR